MERKNIIISMGASAVIFAVLLWRGLASIDPRRASWLGFISITLILLLFLWSLFGALLLLYRSWRSQNGAVASALRQASLLAAGVVLAAYLARFNLLTWLNALILSGILILSELFFLGKEGDGNS